MNFIVCILLISLLIFSIKQKQNPYSSFCCGAKKGVNLALDLLPFIVAIMLMLSLMQISGVTALLCKLLSPILNLLSIPTELTEFVCMRPLTGSGSLALLSEIIKTYGTENFITKCACVMMLSTETAFFSSAIYFSKTKKANTALVLAFSLIMCILAMIFSALICTIIF